MTMLLPDIPTDRSCLMHNHCPALWQLPFYPEWEQNPPNLQWPNLDGHTAIWAWVTHQDVRNRKNDHCSFTDSTPSTRNYPGPWYGHSLLQPHLNTNHISTNPTGGQPHSRAPTVPPKLPVTMLARASIQSTVVMMSESPGSAPRPSCKHDRNTSQPTLLPCVRRTGSLAPRPHPWGCCRVSAPCSVTEPNPPGSALSRGFRYSLQATFTSNSPLKSTSWLGWHFNTRRFFPKKLSKSLQVMHLPSQRRALDRLRQPPPSKVSPAKRGTSFCAADVNPHLSPLQSRTERMKLVFLASCIFQDSVSRKKCLYATARETQQKLPLPVLQPILFALQSATWPKTQKGLRCVFLQS